MEWRNLYRGLIMGASDVIPGVSGGTIAVVLGIYDRLIEAINGIFSRDFKKHFLFLFPLGLGVLTAIFLLARIIEWLFEHYPAQTKFAFLGLIIGVLPFLFTKSEAKRNFNTPHYLLVLLGIAIVAPMMFLQTGEGAIITEFTTSTYIWLFVSGFIASAAMILPGISGSFVLLVIGSYATIISAINDRNLLVIFITGVGILLGILLMSKVIHKLFAKFPIATYAVVIGMVIGSIFVIFPGFPATTPGIVGCVVTFAIGLLSAYLLGKVEYE